MFITELKPNEVFVFGSNSTGFHGAGAAGLAFRGNSDRNWRTDPFFLKAMNSPLGSPDRIGKWAILGVARGYQSGKEGASYAVETISRPGQLRSTSRREIYHQLVGLWRFAHDNRELSLLVTPLGEGYSGWTREEMGKVWDFLRSQHGTPDNVHFVGRDWGFGGT